MNVKIIALTEPVSWLKEKGIKTAEDLLVYEARVSNPANQLNNETADKLIAFMIHNKHWSPFDMINMTMEVTTSKAISIQILRHWSIKPQEFSQRYAEVTDVEPIEFRLKAESNRQSSTYVIGEINNEANDESIKKWFETKYITADGKTLPGLIRRRKAEADLYFKK